MKAHHDDRGKAVRTNSQSERFSQNIPSEIGNYMKGNFIRAALVIICGVVLLSSISACRRSPTSQDETPDTSSYHPEPTPASDFERQMKFIRGSHFKYVWVFTRSDGQKFIKEDADILHQNAPKVVDWISVEGGKQYIAGSNFDIDRANMVVLKKRFRIEDYSGK